MPENLSKDSGSLPPVGERSPSASLLREPLLHFLLAGTALFLAVGLFSAESADRGDAVVVTAEDTRRLAETWEQQWQRPPTEAELLGQVKAYVRIEVLYREALALGLDEGDSVIRRRLAQRMQFILEDLGDESQSVDAAYLALQDRYEVVIDDERLEQLFAEPVSTPEAQQ